MSLFLLSKFTEEKVQISFGSNQICYKDLQIVEERNIDYNLFFLYSYIKHYSTNVDKAWSTISIFGSIIPIIDYWPIIESQYIHVSRGTYRIFSVQVPVFRWKILYLRFSRRPRGYSRFHYEFSSTRCIKYEISS